MLSPRVLQFVFTVFGWQVPFERCHCWQDIFSASANKDKAHGVANYQARNNRVRYGLRDRLAH